MIKICFLCHGCICRSPMAEMIMKKIIKDNNDEDNYFVTSRAVSYEEIGNDIYNPAKRILQSNNIPYEKHSAQIFDSLDYDDYDYIIVMDEENMYNLNRIIVSDIDNKVHKLLDFTPYENKDIEDPWYTNNYEKVFTEITDGCKGLYKKIKSC